MMFVHPTHNLRFSFDASSYDEICTNCGMTNHEWQVLAKPCTDYADKIDVGPNPVGKDALEKLQALIPSLRTHAFDDCDEQIIPTHLCNIVAELIEEL